MAPIVMASDNEVDPKVLTRSTVEKKDFDGYICNLNEGDLLEWTVTYVSGSDLNVRLMTGSEYDNLKAGKSPVYFSQYSRDRTEFYEEELNATGTFLGRIVLVVQTQGEANSTSTYDIEVKVTVAKGPQNLLDMLCGLGVGICALLIIGAIVLVVMVYYLFKRFSGIMSDGTAREDRPEAKGVDGMMRPGFNVAIGPAAEPAKPKSKKGKGKARPVPSKAVSQRRSPSRTAPAKPKGAIKCPGCGETVDAGEGFCPSCGSDLE